jgi:hypothetical protein
VFANLQLDAAAAGDTKRQPRRRHGGRCWRRGRRSTVTRCSMRWRG